MNRPIDHVLEQLDGDVKGNGSGFLTFCPAHDDRNNPSLAVSEAEDGRVLLHCFVGCETTDILEALSLEMKDLFPSKKRKQKKTPSPVGDGESNGCTVAHVSEGGEATKKVNEAEIGCADKKTLSSSTKKGEEAPLAELEENLFTSLPSNTDATVQPVQEDTLVPCTLAEFSEFKKLPVEFLRKQGVSDKIYRGNNSVRFSYKDESGAEVTVRLRIARDGDDRFRWRSGSKAMLYGLWKLPQIRKAGYVVLVEGESDALTLWYLGIPALAVPGASTWKPAWSDYLEGIDRVYLSVEPDHGGQNLLEKVAKSLSPDKLRILELPYKDPSEMFKSLGPDVARKHLVELLKSALTIEERERARKEQVSDAAYELCKELAEEKLILERFEEDLERIGVTGEGKAAKVLFLAMISRYLEKIVSVALKGPSSGGKSYVAGKVLEFFPEEAFFDLTAMSERALAYTEEPMKRRFLVIYEASGMEGEMQTYLIRSLLSEGKLRYMTVESGPEGPKPRLIEREGPTGLIVTTTAVKLHPENETRLLSMTITDTKEQTQNVFGILAEEEPDEYGSEVLLKWHALSAWLDGAEHRTTIPYAKALADLVAPVAVRLRRDFSVILSLVRSHAILHQATREKDEKGRIIATLDDYAVVRELVVDLISEGVEATVPSIVRETVEKLDELNDAADRKGINIIKLAEALELDKSAAWRRVRSAIDRGYIRNLEERKGRPAKLVPGEPLPDDVEILPTVETLARRSQSGCTVASVLEGREETKKVGEGTFEEEENLFASLPPDTRATVQPPNSSSPIGDDGNIVPINSGDYDDDPDDDPPTPPSGGHHVVERGGGGLEEVHHTLRARLQEIEEQHPGAPAAFLALSEEPRSKKEWSAAASMTQKALTPIIKQLEDVGLVIVTDRKDTYTKKDGSTGKKTTKLYSRPPASAETDERYVYTTSALDEVLQRITSYKGRVAVDLETDGLNPIHSNIRIITVGLAESANSSPEIYVVDASRVDATPLVRALEDKRLIFHNATFDVALLHHHYGFDPPEDIEDTQDLSRVVHAGDWEIATDKSGEEYCEPFSHSLDAILERELGVEHPLKDKYQKGHNWQLHKILHVEHVEYAAFDVVFLNDIAKKLYELGREMGLQKTLELEKETRPAFLAMVVAGIPVDVEAWKEVIREKADEEARLLEKLNGLASDPPEGKEWVWGGNRKELDNHPHAAFSSVGLQVDNVREAHLKEKLEETGHPLLRAFIEWKSVRSEVSKNRNYLEGRVVAGRFYSEWDQCGTETGRSSSSEPNAQNIPKAGPYRSLIRPEEGYVFVDGDLAQIELRCLGDITEDPVMREVFLNPDRDLHRELAEAIVGHEVDKGSPLRDGAKRINFGLSYGLGKHALMTILKNYYGIAEQDLEDKAVEIRNLVLERYPGVKDWMDRERRLAREEELETRTLIGRRRVLKKYYSDYIDDWAVSPQERYASPIQGTAADIYKLALARLHQIIKDGDSKIILAVHDQITLECQRRQADEHKEILEKVLRDATAEILRDDAYARGKVADVEIKTNWSKT